MPAPVFVNAPVELAAAPVKINVVVLVVTSIVVVVLSVIVKLRLVDTSEPVYFKVPPPRTNFVAAVELGLPIELFAL